MLKKAPRETDTAVKVQLVTPDAAFEQRLTELFGRDGRFELATSRATAGEVDPEKLVGAHPNVCLVEVDPDDAQELAALEQLMSRHLPGRPMIVVTEAFCGNAARKLFRLQVTDWVPKTASDNELLEACERAIQTENVSNRFTGAACYAFLPAAGGVGNTALAIQSAFLMAGKTQQFRSTCLVDMDFQWGSIADYLDLSPNLQLDEVASMPERLDEQLLEVMASRHQSGVAVLAAENALRDYGEIGVEFVGRMLDMASAKFDNVIIDIPRVWLPWTESVLLGCNKVYIVTEMTVPGLRHARRLIDAIDEKCGEEINTSVVVNRCRPRLIGGGVNSLRPKDAEALLGDKLGGFVTEDYRLVREAIDRGVPLCEVKRGNAIDKDLAGILFGEAEQPERRSLFANLVPSPAA
ncbi:MAG: response regulator receiver protein [Hyphomicrobiales bacterium]|nr:response regulator receiver protein [Hyphomicrobiales bacterium]